MEAICKADYELRVLASMLAIKEKERRKKEAEEAARMKRRAEEKGYSKRRRQTEQKDLAVEGEEEQQEIIVPDVGFHDIYGVWFFGKLTEIIREIGKIQFGMELQQMMHVYVDAAPKTIPDGIHDISVYGHACCLYKWTAQGYHRGLVVLADDKEALGQARIYRDSGTWSWVLGSAERKRLEETREGE
jgi:hypothetical protein